MAIGVIGIAGAGGQHDAEQTQETGYHVYYTLQRICKYGDGMCEPPSHHFACKQDY
jgi:hypothetical protein